jgi:four helix bundle protein
MAFKFERLEIWQLAIEFADDVHQLTRKFPKEEMYSLTSQFKRAADSIALNISEGSIGQSDKEQRRFMGYSIRSTAECVSCLFHAIKRKYINQVEFTVHYKKAETLFVKCCNYKNGIGKFSSADASSGFRTKFQWPRQNDH